MLDKIDEAAAGSQPERGDAAEAFQIAIGHVAALAQLGEDFQLALRVRVDGDLHVHVAKGGHLANAEAADDLGQVGGLDIGAGGRAAGPVRRLDRGRGALGAGFALRLLANRPAGRAIRWGRAGPLARIGVGLFALAVLQGHRLAGAATVAVDSDAFAVQLVGQVVNPLDVSNGGRAREIDGLADRGVAMLLKSGLHAHVPFRRNIVGAHKHPANVLGHLGDARERAFGRQAFQQFVGQEASLLSDPAEQPVDLDQRLFALLLAAQDVPNER